MSSSQEGHQLALSSLFEADRNNGLQPTADKFEWKILWSYVIFISMIHLGAVYGAYLFFTKAMWATNLFAVFLYLSSTLGVTAGAHRLWSHKSYKARLPLRLFLVFFYTMTLQKSVVWWVLRHRMHHKYSDTHADPHNINRGFFFSHVGWILMGTHPSYKAKRHTIDMSDIWGDPVLRFQYKYYYILACAACLILPTYIPTLWGESNWNAFFVCVIFRLVSLLNVTWLVNSAAHKWGYKPYDKNIKPRENYPVALLALGEGHHNYHHTFPWDYKTSEFGHYAWNFTKLFIDAMAKIGWAYDLKTASSDLIKKRIKETGNGSHEEWGGHRVAGRNDFNVD